jgi:hypothetical protein
MQLVPLRQLHAHSALGSLRALGSDPAPIADAARNPALEAGAIAAVALGSIAGVILYGTGQTKLAAMLGATGIIVGATFSIVRVLDQGRSGEMPVISSLL